MLVAVSLLVKLDGTDSSGHRGSFDIMADILAASSEGSKKTNLMYHCNLSFKQLKSYSGFLLYRGLLKTNGQVSQYKNEVFEVTAKGKEFLRAYKGLKALMK